MSMRLLAATLIGAATLFGSAVSVAGQPGPWESCFPPPEEEYCLTVTYTPPNTLTMVWDDVSDLPWITAHGFVFDYYQVNIGGLGGDGSRTPLHESTATTFSYTIDWEGIEPGTTTGAWVAIDAVDADGNSGLGAAIFLWRVRFELRRPDDEPQAPTAPMGLTLTAGDGSLLSTWTAPVNDGGSAITGYRVQWRSGIEDWNSRSREATSTTTEHEISGLTNGVTYTARVAAMNAGGVSPWSTEVTGTPLRDGMTATSVDREALMALYNATDGPNWRTNTNWGTDEPISTWHGVSVNSDDGRVRRLELSVNELAGSLPPELGNLSGVTSLNFRRNERLTGRIPPELGNLVFLRSLNLAFGGLTGPIPAELGNLGNLQELDISHNGDGMTGPLPRELGSLSNLRSLELNNNNLTGVVPPEWGYLANLTRLDLSYNSLVGQLPRTFLQIDPRGAVLWFAIGSNAGLCVPRDAEFDAWLEQMPLFSGERCTEPPTLTVPDAPTGLVLTAGDRALVSTWMAPVNDGGAAIASYKVQWRSDDENWDRATRETTTMTTRHEIGGLTNGVTYAVRVAAVNAEGPGAWSGEATGVPNARHVVEAHDRDALMALYNATDGPNWRNNTNWGTDEPISTWYGVSVNSDDGRVRRLELSVNELAGSLPPELGNLSRVTSLNFRRNERLTGRIPRELGNLAFLRSLNLAFGGLTGPIPAELGNLGNLQELDISLNGDGMTGPLPRELGSLSNLRSLKLSNNNLTGVVPPEWGYLADLTRLDLSSNSLVGQLPRTFLQIDPRGAALWFEIGSNAGLCVPRDAEFDAWLEQMPLFSGERCAATVIARTQEEVQGNVNGAIAAATNGTGLYAGGTGAAVPLGALFMLPAGGSGFQGFSYAGFAFTGESERAEVVGVEIQNGMDGPEILLTPGLEAGSVSVAVEARVEGRPATEPAAAMVAFDVEVQATVPTVPVSATVLLAVCLAVMSRLYGNRHQIGRRG